MAEESKREAAAAAEAVREERVPKKVESVDKTPKKETAETDFLLDLDDDDFTFFDYDDDEK